MSLTLRSTSASTDSGELGNASSGSPVAPAGTLPGSTSGVRALWSYTAGRRGRLGLAVVLATVAAALGLAQPIVVNQLISTVQAAGRSVGPLAAVLITLVVVSASISGWQQYLLGEVGETVVKGARRRLVGSMMRLPISEYDKRSAGEMVSRLTSDTTLIRAAVSGGIVGLLGSALTIVGSVVALLYIDLVTFAISIGIASLAVLTSAVAARPVRSINAVLQENIGALGARLQRTLASIRVIRAHNAADQHADQLEVLIDDAYRSGLRLNRVVAIVGPVSTTLVNLALVAAIVVSGLRAAAGALDLASLVTFLMFFNMLITPLNQLSSAIMQIQQALAGHNRITELTSIPFESRDDVPNSDAEKSLSNHEATEPQAPAITFDGVTFAYQRGTTTIDGVSFSAPAGGRTALVGPSGAGKSTLLCLLERFFEPSSGQIRIDGLPIGDLSRDSLRALIGYVDQGATALSGTLRENLQIGSIKYDESQISEVLSSVRLDGLLHRLESGLDTPIGEGGSAISGGERQRISIARALLRKPRILLLDEPTSSLDGRTESQFDNVLEAAASSMTILVIAHRLATVRQADQIVVIDEGRIVDQGTHAELVDRCSLYRELSSTQLT